MVQYLYLSMMKLLVVNRMGRTELSPQRLAATQRTNIGRIIIFCEGNTEKYYFDYFSEILNMNKFTDVEVVTESVNANALTVLNFANEFLSLEENNRKFSAYGKYLAFDCDDPKEIQAVITAAKDYELLISNYLFEIWLLMHYEEVELKLSKQQIYQHLSEYLNSPYRKGKKGIIREIIRTGSIEKAIDNGIKLEKVYEEQGKTIDKNIKEMNPFSNVYKVIEQFMLEIS